MSGAVVDTDEMCGQGCNRPATCIVVTVNDWLLTTCDECARQLCDPISGGTR